MSLASAIHRATHRAVPPGRAHRAATALLAAALVAVPVSVPNPALALPGAPTGTPTSGAVQGSAVQGSAVQGSAVQGSAVQISTADYLPGVAADLYLPGHLAGKPGHLPRHARAVPLVVTIPGGGWATADRSGLGQLAEAFAGDGVAVYNATYRIGEGTVFPVPAQDVRCAVDAGVHALRSRGLRAEPVVLLGHSAGAHLSSLAAFGDRAFQTRDCPYPPSRMDGWVGLAGVYDLRVVGSWAWQMMGATQEEDPDGYARAATETYLAKPGPHAQRLRTLVVHGEADELIPPFVGGDFADLLREHGYRTQLALVPGADHNAAYQAPVVADLVLGWLRALRSAP